MRSTNTKSSIQNIIDGEKRDGVSSRFFSHVSPRIDSPPIEVVQSDLMDVVQAVQAMNRATAVWAKATREERESHVQKTLAHFRQSLDSHQSELAEHLAIDIGLPVTTSRTRSLPAAQKVLDGVIENFGGLRSPSSGNAALFLGWTDPLLGFCRRVPLIFATGHAVCIKPSSRAPRTATRLAELWTDALKSAEAPLGLFALLNGRGAKNPDDSKTDETVGTALLQHPGFKTIYWIGRSDAALQAQLIALGHGKRFHFVGSGRNPAILFHGYEDQAYEPIISDLAAAIVDPHSYGPYRPSRLFVHESIYKATLEKLAAKLQTLKVGDPLKSETVVGPLPASEAQRFDTQVQLALSETGHLVTGGKRDGNLIQPTLIRDLTNCSTLQSEELAGPWATIASFKYAHEALKYANTSPLGLAAYVLHPDHEKARATAEKVEVSRVFFSASPPWPDAFVLGAPAVKQSANQSDGTTEVLAYAPWRSTLYG